MKKDKKMSERILNHILEILSLLTGEVSVLQRLTNSLTVLEMNKDRQKTKRILNHTLEIMYLLTGEEYTIVKKNTPQEYDSDRHKDIMLENRHSLRGLEIPANRNSGLNDESTVSTMEELQVEREKTYCQPVETHQDLCEDPALVPVKEELEDEIDEEDDIQLVEIHSDLCADSVSVKEEEDERDNWDIQEVETNLDSHTDGSMDMRTAGPLHNSQGTLNFVMWNSDESIIYQGAGQVNITPSKIGRKSNMNLLKEFSCPECGKCFRQNSELSKHLRSHTGVRQFTCHVCEKCFSNKSALVVHQRIHTGEKPFSCSECGKLFKQKSHLMSHKKVHTGEKQFSCPGCDKCFSHKADLVRHLRIHTGEKPFACSECGKLFSQRSHIISHQKIHTS
ncbi:uncharacterized protein O3C94_016849 isoform 1-T2 [Discoglossus pictus]